MIMLRPAFPFLIFLLFLYSSGCASFAHRLVAGTVQDPPYAPSEQARELHRSLLVIDLHADPLLWERDILERSSAGHVDLPRLQEGNVGLQVFGVVTGFPLFPSLNKNKDGTDAIKLLAKLQDWPEETYESRLQRALYQAKKLEDRVAASNGALTLIRSRADLGALLTARANGTPVIGAMLSLEGTHALEGDPANLDRLFEAGFRMVGLTHLFDTEMAGSTHGMEKYGLTEQGRKMVRTALDRGMVIDLAHASPAAMADVIAMTDRPVIASHGGVRGTCDTARNLSDDQVRAIAGTGGVVGIGLYDIATCGRTIGHTVKAMRHVANVAGIEHVALGSDFDGATAIIDASGLALLTGELTKDGFSREEIAAIMGGNALRVLRQVLPDK